MLPRWVWGFLVTAAVLALGFEVISWVAVLIVLAFAGFLLYLLFSLPRRR
jgi:hypothetical protein